MDSISSKIETFFSSFIDREGHLSSRYDPILDGLEKNLVEIRGLRVCPPPTTLAIIQGLQSVQQIRKDAGNLTAQGDEGNWSYALFGSPEVNITLSINSDRHDGAIFYFQLDPSGQVCGSFSMSEENEREEQLIVYTFELRPDGYYVCQPGEGDLGCRMEIPAGIELPWRPSPPYDFLDELLPAEGHGISQWIQPALPPDREKDQPAQPRSPAPKFCSDCGSPLEASARFCGQCAAPVQSAQIPVPERTVPLAAATIPKPKSSLSPREMQLIVQPGGQTIALNARLTIGRDLDNHLRLEDAKLSRHHAVIETADNGWLLHDLSSTNGTRVNGTQVRGPLMLQAGDVIELGDTRLTLGYR